MPPDENKNNSNFSPLKVGIDPIFKNSQTKTEPPVSNSAFGVLNNQQYTPTANPIPNQIPNQTTFPKKSLIRTYKGDIESTVQADHVSSVNIAIAENEKMRGKLESGEVVNIQTENKAEYSKSKIIIFVSLILVVVAIVGIGVTLFLKNKTSSTTVATQTIPTLITTEYKDELNTVGLNKNQFVTTLSGKLNDIRIPVNNFYNTYVTTGTSTSKRLITAQEFVTLSGLRMPDQIKRTLLPDFMVGMFSFDENMPFVIFKTSYFENTFAGMLAWEKDLEKDFQVLFRLNGLTSGGLLADLSPTTAKKFEDSVIINKDVRQLKDTDGNVILLYSILDKDTLVITTDEEAFKAIVDRINKEKSLKR
ncbi:MAG: hypothetical protein WC027_00735 [Candidatus Paceibacterota bacterium]